MPWVDPRGVPRVGTSLKKERKKKERKKEEDLIEK